MSDVQIDGVHYRPVDFEEAKELSEYIREFKTEGTTFYRERFKRSSKPGQWNEGMYGDGDENAPFFTEAFLYNLLGKDEARSVLGIMRRLCVLAGVNFRG